MRARTRSRRFFLQVIRKHIESTILHEISHVLPTSDEFAKDEDEDEEEESSGGWGQEGESAQRRARNDRHGAGTA